ncbi:MAG: hypothetical protein LIQ31_06555 [Planctomycetes bacterium]|nr:hypothetical protein [Planctomycetota bacterium]
MRTRTLFSALALTLGMTCLPGCQDDQYAMLGTAGSDVAGAAVMASDTALANDAELVETGEPVVRYSRTRRPVRQPRTRRQSPAAPVRVDGGAPVSPNIDYVPAVVIGPDGTTVSSTTVGSGTIVPTVQSTAVTTEYVSTPVLEAPLQVSSVVMVETPTLTVAPVQAPAQIVTTHVLGYPQRARVSYRRGKGPRRIQRVRRVVAVPATTVSSVASGTFVASGTTSPAITSTEVYNIEDVVDTTSTEPTYSMYVAGPDGTTTTASAAPVEPEPSYAKYLVDPETDAGYGYEANAPVVSTPITSAPYIAYDVYEPTASGTGMVSTPVYQGMTAPVYPVVTDYQGQIVPQAWQADPNAVQVGVQNAMQPEQTVMVDPLAEPLTDPYASAYVQPESLVPGGIYQAGGAGGVPPVIQPVVIQPVIQPVIQAAGVPYGQVMGTSVGAPVEYYGVLPGQEMLPQMTQPIAMTPFTPGPNGPGFPAAMPAYAMNYCAPLMYNPVVCAPGQNLSECFTLNDYQVQNSQIYTPTAQGPLDFQPAPGMPAPPSERSDAQFIPDQPVASAVTPTSPVAPIPPAPLAPSAPAAPVTQAPSMPSAPPSAPVGAPVPLPPPAEMVSSKYAGLSEAAPSALSAPAAPVTPPSVSMPAPLGSRDVIPPVPAASDIESALEAMTGADTPYLK